MQYVRYPDNSGGMPSQAIPASPAKVNGHDAMRFERFSGVALAHVQRETDLCAREQEGLD